MATSNHDDTREEQNEQQRKQKTEVTDERFQHELLLKLDELRKTNFLCDTTISAEGQEFPTHRCVLSAGSDYFKALFSSELQVKENQSSLVELHEMKSATIATVLQFIYTSKANINTSNAQDVVIASDYLIIPSLKSKAAQFLGESMNASNCLALESFASQYNCESLRQAAVKYTCQHFIPVVKISNDFRSLGFEKVKELMCEDELNISEEEEVYEAVMAWVKHALSSRECFLPELLKCLRLFSMSKYSLRKILNKEELVIKSPICTTILNDGLDFFLFPDRFLGRLLKHRSSIQNEEHVVVLTGGYDNGRVRFKDTDCFIFATKKWQSLSKMPDSCLSEEAMYSVSAVCGGLLYMMDDSDRISYFNPNENAWRSKNTPFTFHPGCTLTSFNEELYLIGGDCEESMLKICDVYKYNPICYRWKELASMETSRADHCAVVLEDLIYVIGGCDSEACLQSVESYDPSTNQWRKIPDLINARKSAAVGTACGKILVIGGYDFDSHHIEATCEIFDPCVNQWSLVSSPNVPRAACGIVSVDDVVYVFGGETGDHGHTILDSVECFDINCNEWREVDADMPRCRTYCQALLVKLPKIYIFADQ